MKKDHIFLYGILSLIFFSVAFHASAHEAYVLPIKDFMEGLKINSSHPLVALTDPAHFKSFALIGFGVAISYILVSLGSATKLAAYVDTLIRKACVIGPFIIRLAISFSLFASAQGNIIFGPELSLASMQFALPARFLLFLASLMIFFGFFTEVGALIGVMLFAYSYLHFGPYILTYTNYLGELIVLVLFGSRAFSLDKIFFKNQRFIKHAVSNAWETPIVRFGYALALIYAGYTIKFLHQDLSIQVYNEYHLQNFFHASASFIAAGAGLSEVAIGILLLLGLAMRWTILISLIFITLSILYFQELLWPHLLLYGISISLFINAGDFLTVEHFLLPWIKGKIRLASDKTPTGR